MLKAGTQSRAFLFSPHYLVVKKTVALLEQWIKDEVIQLPERESIVFAKDLKHSKYCP